MGRALERDFEALDYGKGTQAKLTAKQYLVYSFLMSISKWDAQARENHYYVYKNSFLVKDACKIINISQPTWRSAIQKLIENFYIIDCGSYYKIRIPNSYAPLEISLIRYLLSFGSQIRGGGIIVSLYSVLYKYWYYCRMNDEDCEVNINQLRKLFSDQRHEKEIEPLKLMLALFETSGLIDIKRQIRKFKGKEYIAYQIKNVSLKLPSNIVLEDQGPEDVEQIIKALWTSIEASNI